MQGEEKILKPSNRDVSHGLWIKRSNEAIGFVLKVSASSPETEQNWHFYLEQNQSVTVINTKEGLHYAQSLIQPMRVCVGVSNVRTDVTDYINVGEFVLRVTDVPCFGFDGLTETENRKYR